MSRITVLRPDVVDPPRAALTLAPRSDPPEQVVIGLVANGKPLAAELLQALSEELRKRLRRHVIDRGDPQAVGRVSHDRRPGRRNGRPCALRDHGSRRLRCLLVVQSA